MAQHTINELLSLLDQPTLNTLTERLHKVASAHEAPKAPNQLLFEFIDSGLTACEDELESPDARNLAVEILEQVEV